MPAAVGSLMRRAAVVLCLSLSWAASVAAQTPVAVPPTSPGFLSRYDFRLSAVTLSGDDPRFVWDTHFGGDLDLVDYVHGRVTLLADYETLLGSEFRSFDPNQSYYTLEASSSVRAGGAEIAGAFHHVSRHLSDRPKSQAVAWNILEARLVRGFDFESGRLEVRASAGRVVQRSFVDYAWVAGLELLTRRSINGRFDLFAHGHGRMFGVDGTIAGRDAQTGGLIEAGLRVNGRAGAVELFAGFEKRPDASPLDWAAQRWAFVGFRLVGR